MAITCYIGFGSNLGDLMANLESARERLRNVEGVFDLKTSKLYHSEPLTHDGQEQSWYLNCVFEICTTLPLHALFSELKNIESALGRTRESKWNARTVDLDLLFYDLVIYNDNALRVPHREIINRRFVLLPLCDLAPDFEHPEFEIPLRELLDITEDKLHIQLFSEAH